MGIFHFLEIKSILYPFSESTLSSLTLQIASAPVTGMEAGAIIRICLFFIAFYWFIILIGLLFVNSRTCHPRAIVVIASKILVAQMIPGAPAILDRLRASGKI